MKFAMDEKIRSGSNASDAGDSDPMDLQLMESTAHLSDVRFNQLNHRLSYMLIRAIATLPYDYMTQVQKMTMPVIMGGQDCLVKAPTGTGKTMAFLLPLLDNLYRKEFGRRPLSREQYNKMKVGREAAKARGDLLPRERRIRVLILAPTRELAIQIGNEAEKLLNVQQKVRLGMFYGGRKIYGDMRRLLGRVDVAVCTPGRLLDLINQDEEFAERLQGVEALVLDEADRMLDQGFAESMKTIMDTLPKRRQTLLFSATMPQEIVELAPHILANRPTFEYFDTTKPDPLDPELALRHTYCSVTASQEERVEFPGKLEADDPLAVAKHIKQYYVVADLPDQGAMLYQALMREIMMNRSDHKIIVFFSTTRAVELNTALFRQMADADESTKALGSIMEMHSKKEQYEREHISKEFKHARSGIMFTSDVSARGMDYPGVTLVVQVGISASTEQYVHRLGRTGRAGKAGKGLLIVLPDEVSFVEELKHSNVAMEEAAEGSEFGKPPAAQLEQMKGMIAQSMDTLPPGMKKASYAAWVGFYNNALKVTGWSRGRLLAHAEEYAIDVMRLYQVPYLSPAVAQALGLSGVLDKAMQSGSAREAFPPGHQDRFSQRAMRDRQAKNFSARRFDQFRQLDLASFNGQRYIPHHALKGVYADPNRTQGKRRLRTCFVCRDSDHIARDSPENLGKNTLGCFVCGKKNCPQQVCPQVVCKKCGNKGHMVGSCPIPDLNRRQTCFLCGETGHMRHTCPTNQQLDLQNYTDARICDRRINHVHSDQGAIWESAEHHFSEKDAHNRNDVVEDAAIFLDQIYKRHSRDWASNALVRDWNTLLLENNADREQQLQDGIRVSSTAFGSVAIILLLMMPLVTILSIAKPRKIRP